jgi:hypothetical protein
VQPFTAGLHTAAPQAEAEWFTSFLLTRAAILWSSGTAPYFLGETAQIAYESSTARNTRARNGGETIASTFFKRACACAPHMGIDDFLLLYTLLAPHARCSVVKKEQILAFMNLWICNGAVQF